MRVLYISYDGMLEPLGQSQVMAYQQKLARSNAVHLLSFEKPQDWGNELERKSIAQKMKAAGIVWHPLRYHKHPTALATAYDVLLGITLGVWIVVRYRLTIVHARSYVPAVMALALKRITGVNFLFDMRGFWADERVDGGLWPSHGRMYRVAKWFERRFLLGADHVVSLTHSAVRIMKGFDYLQGCMPPFTVIPTCTDLQRFRPAANTLRDKPFVLGYVGTVGTWYLFDEVVASFRILLQLRPDARLLVVNRGEHEHIRQRLCAGGIPESTSEIVSATHADVPGLMSRMSGGIFFIKPAYSKQASAPTKLAEFLGCGIPCLSNAGVGDMADVLEAERVGVAVKSFDETSLRQGVEQLLRLLDDDEVSDRCVAAAHRHFSLDEGVSRYERIYASLQASA